MPKLTPGSKSPVDQHSETASTNSQGSEEKGPKVNTSPEFTARFTGVREECPVNVKADDDRGEERRASAKKFGRERELDSEKNSGKKEHTGEKATGEQSSSPESGDLKSPPKSSTKSTGKSPAAAVIHADDTAGPQVESSPLLASTPPAVSRSLVPAYPYTIYADKVLAILTWTDTTPALSCALVASTVLFITYFEPLVTFAGHLFPVTFLALFSLSCAYVEKQQREHPTLDDVVQKLTSVAKRSQLLLSPITGLNLTAYDLKRLVFTAVFLSPMYVLVSYFLMGPRAVLCAVSVLVLTYHSPWARVTRRLVSRSQTARMACFYMTGLDLDGQGRINRRQRQGSRSAASQGTASLLGYAVRRTGEKLRRKKGPARFTYVLYENQRRWLGIGWTPNLLSYERTPWTDEFLNESEDPENFTLPQLSAESGMHWRWVDRTWRVDLTNDGSIQLASTHSRTTADPKPDEGYIYYDNTWKNPTTEDSFSKYTRRRRWVRTAELVSDGQEGEVEPLVETSAKKHVQIQAPEPEITKHHPGHGKVGKSALKSPKSLRSPKIVKTLETPTKKSIVIEPIKKVDEMKDEDDSSLRLRSTSVSKVQVISAEGGITNSTTAKKAAVKPSPEIKSKKESEEQSKKNE